MQIVLQIRIWGFVPTNSVTIKMVWLGYFVVSLVLYGWVEHSALPCGPDIPRITVKYLVFLQVTKLKYKKFHLSISNITGRKWDIGGLQ